MVLPHSIKQKRFTDVRAHQVADDGDGVGFAFRHEARDGVTVLFIVERDALDDPTQALEGKRR